MHLVDPACANVGEASELLLSFDYGIESLLIEKRFAIDEIEIHIEIGFLGRNVDIAAFVEDIIMIEGGDKVGFAFDRTLRME